MDQKIELTKPQEPWIGSRGRIGVVIPSTNTAVEYDCQRFLPEGVTWHFARFWVNQPDLSSDNMFLAFIDAIRPTIPLAMRDILTAEMDYIMMGMSAETFWGGLEGNAEFEDRIRDVMGPDMGLTSGAKAVQDALNAFEVKNVSVVTPYQPVGDEQVYRFFSESGFNVINVVGLKCDTATSISHTPRSDIVDCVINELDGDNVDAIVQVGTNLSTVDLFPTLEKQLGKPVIPINVASIWHSLRAIGVEDKFVGKGMLFEQF
jgi:maleate isomerase